MGGPRRNPPKGPIGRPLLFGIEVVQLGDPSPETGLRDVTVRVTEKNGPSTLWTFVATPEGHETSTPHNAEHAFYLRHAKALERRLASVMLQACKQITLAEVKRA